MMASWLSSTALLHLNQRELHASLDEQRVGDAQGVGAIW